MHVVLVLTHRVTCEGDTNNSSIRHQLSLTIETDFFGKMTMNKSIINIQLICYSSISESKRKNKSNYL